MSRHAIIKEIALSLGLDRQGSIVTPGRIVVHCRSYDTAAAALAAFAGFGGQGWLCTAEERQAEIFSNLQGQPVKGRWPRWGELVNGERSLHLRHTGHCWTLAELRTEEDPEGVLIETHYLGEGRLLRYQVSYPLTAVDGLMQHRPHCSRFLGFAQGERP